MQRLLRLAVLLPTLALLPVAGLAQNAKKTEFDETKVRTAQLNGTFIQGKLAAHDDEKWEFTVVYVHQVKTPNLDNRKKYDALKKQYQQALARKDKAGAQKLADDASTLAGALDNVEEYPIQFECKGPKGMPIRTLAKPVGDDGKPKKLTAAEDKKLKGDDPKLPGYTVDIKNLDNDIIVRVYIDKAKLKELLDAKKDDKKDAKKDDKKDDKKKDDKSDSDKTDKTLYPITLLVIPVPPKEGGTAGGTNPFATK
jgi:hypothetical protein